MMSHVSLPRMSNLSQSQGDDCPLCRPLQDDLARNPVDRRGARTLMPRSAVISSSVAQTQSNASISHCTELLPDRSRATDVLASVEPSWRSRVAPHRRSFAGPHPNASCISRYSHREGTGCELPHRWKRNCQKILLQVGAQPPADVVPPNPAGIVPEGTSAAALTSWPSIAFGSGWPRWRSTGTLASRGGAAHHDVDALFTSLRSGSKTILQAAHRHSPGYLRESAILH